jgi:Putative restriction endonuclease
MRYAPHVQRAPATWVIDPDDPRAPPQEIWDQMTPDERRRLLDALPSEFEVSQANPPEGDFHFEAKTSAKDVLGGFFQRIGRRVYVAAELPVYYPGQRMFAPDVFAVLGVEIKPRASWSVSAEGKGLDFAMEIVWAGRAKKDLEENVARYASLGISEYFVFDRRRLRLRGYRLPPGASRYQPLVPQEGRLTSGVLGLDLAIDREKLRFYHGLAPLPESDELIARLGSMLNDVEGRMQEAEGRMEEAERRADEAERLAEENAAKLAEALAEIERLKRERG